MTGYNETFLGEKDCKIPLPDVGACGSITKTKEGKSWAHYNEAGFSLAMSKSNNMAVCVAGNYFGKGKGKRKTGYFLDKGNYKKQQQWKYSNHINEPWENGHVLAFSNLTINNATAARQANYCTNIAIHHEKFHAERAPWYNLEIKMSERFKKASIFVGPVFTMVDRYYHASPNNPEVKIRIPSAFWKIVATRDNNSINVYAFLFFQERWQARIFQKYCADANSINKWSHEVLWSYRCSTTLIERITGIVFDERLKDNNIINFHSRHGGRPSPVLVPLYDTNDKGSPDFFTDMDTIKERFNILPSEYKTFMEKCGFLGIATQL